MQTFCLLKPLQCNGFITNFYIVLLKKLSQTPPDLNSNKSEVENYSCCSSISR